MSSLNALHQREPFHLRDAWQELSKGGGPRAEHHIRPYTPTLAPPSPFPTPFSMGQILSRGIDRGRPPPPRANLSVQPARAPHTAHEHLKALIHR